MAIDCFNKVSLPKELVDKFNNSVNESMSDADQAVVGMRIAREYYKDIHSRLNAVKKKHGFKEDKFEQPADFEPAVAEINKNYKGKAEEINRQEKERALNEELKKGLDLNQAEREASDKFQKRAVSAAKNVKRALGRVAPDVKIVFFRGAEAGKKLLGLMGGDPQMTVNGFYSKENNTIALDLSEMESNTPFHEGIHPVINLLKERNPELFKKFTDFAESVPHEVGGTYGEVMGSPEEALVELLADVADGVFDKNKSVLGKVKEFIQKILDWMGLGKQYDLNTSDLAKFAGDLAEALSRGKEIQMLGVAEKSSTPQPQPKKYEMSDERSKRVAQKTESLVRPGKTINSMVLWRKDKGQDVAKYSGPASLKSVRDVSPKMYISQTDNFINGFFKNGETTPVYLIRPTDIPAKPEGAEAQLAWADKVYAKAKAAIVSNLLFIHDSIPASVRDISKLWYDGANVIAQELSKKYGVSPEQAAAVIATQSPQKPWFDNVHLAQFIVDFYKNHQNDILTKEAVDYYIEKAQPTKQNPKGYPDQLAHAPFYMEAIGLRFSQLSSLDKAAFMRYAFDNLYERRAPVRLPNGQLAGELDSGLASHSGYSTIERAISVLEDGSPENINRNLGDAFKIKNFYNNIINPKMDGEVTIDTHAMAAGHLLPIGSSSALVNFKELNYALFAEAYREAAKQRGILAREMQSITWEGVKSMFPPESKVKTKQADQADLFLDPSEEFVNFANKTWASFKNGEITQKEAQKRIKEHGKDLATTGWTAHVNQLYDGPAPSYIGELPLARRGNTPSEQGVRGDADRTVPGVGGADRRLNRVGPKLRAQAKAQAQDKKLNRTAKRIANDKKSKFVKLKADIILNKSRYMYQTQNLDSEKLKLSNMPLEEVIQKMDDLVLFSSIAKKNEYAVLSAIELLNRYNAAGIDTRPVFDQLRAAGTSMGQLLRQFAELKTTAEGIANVAAKNLKSMGLFLTSQQEAELLRLAKDFTAARTVRNDKRVEFLNGAATKADLDRASEDLSNKLWDLNIYLAKLTPMGVDRMLTTLLQGNLLVFKSGIANFAGNLLNLGKYPESVMGSMMAYSVNRWSKRKPASAAEYFWGSGLNSAGAFGSSIPTAFKNAFTGRMEENDMTVLEVRRNLRPLTAWGQLVGSQNWTLPRDEKGKVPVSVKIEKAIEASPFAMHADVMFRMLYVGDQPFRNSARVAAQYSVFAEEGGKAVWGSLDRFLESHKDKDSDVAKRIEHLTNQATFSEDDGWLYRSVNNVINALDKTPEIMGMGSVMKSVTRVLAKSAMPYVKVPANLIQRTLEYAIPVIPLYGAVRLAKKDPRKSGELFGRAAVGTIMIYTLMGMHAAGVIVAGASDDDESQRMLKYEEKPNGINIDALKRYLSGTQDPENPKKEGDRIWDFAKFGPFGILAAVIAKEEQARAREGAPLLSFNSMVGFLDGVMSGSLEMSFMQGALNMAEEFSQNGLAGVASEMMLSSSAIVAPNNLGVFTRSQNPYILKAKDEDMLSQLAEKLRVRTQVNPVGNDTEIYPIISMFGDAVAQTPEGKDPIAYNFFNVTNQKTINDPMIVEILNLYSRMPQVDPAITKPNDEVRVGDGERLKMTEGDHTYAQMIAGRYKRFEINLLKQEGLWDTMTDDERHEVLKEINTAANTAAVAAIAERVDEGISNGDIVADTDRYTYVERPEFDLRIYDQFKDDLER